MQHNENKKKLMFVTGEDFYFLTYNILLLLKELKCNGEPRKFKDYRKLAFLIDFVSDKDLIKIFKRYDGKGIIYNDEDKKSMINAWSNGLIRTKLLARLLYALEQRDLVGIEKDTTRKSVTIWYKDNEKTKSFFKEDVFQAEKQNAKSLVDTIQRLSSITFETLESKLFTQYGINTHGIPPN